MYRLLTSITLTLCICLCLSSCTKDEFDITGQLKGTAAQNFRFMYYASDAKGGGVQDVPLTVVNGKLQMHGTTHNPTVVWVMDGMGRLVNLIYVERGNKLEVSGDVTKPWQWTVKGNKTTEALSEWMRQNGNLLLNAETQSVNKAVADYVTAHPDQLASAILLAALYQPMPGTEAQYKALQAKLPEEIRNNPAVTAAGSLKAYIPDTPASGSLDPIILYCNKGYADTIDARDYTATVVYFWQNSEDPRPHSQKNDAHNFNMLMLKNLQDRFGTERLQIADINCDQDTIRWLRSVRKDSIQSWSRLWEPGYGMGPISTRMGVTARPYMIVADSNGKIVFRGYDTYRTETAVKDLLQN